MIPADHAVAPNKIAKLPTAIPGEASPLRPSSKATPANPKNAPASKEKLTRHSRAASDESTKTMMGSMAINSEASPEGTRVSAQCKEPCPNRKKSRPPTWAAAAWPNTSRAKANRRADGGIPRRIAAEWIPLRSEWPSTWSPKSNRCWRRRPSPPGG